MRFLSAPSTRRDRWLALSWTIAIVAACSIPAPSLTSIGPALSADKAIHFGLFAVFGALWMRALRPSSSGASRPLRRRALYVLGGGLLFAVGTEVYQHVLPLRRTGDPYDALANGGGLFISVIVYSLLVWERPKLDQAPRVD